MSLAPLRHLLAATPCAEAWRALLLHLDAYQPGDALEVALEYAQTHLQTWPDDLRTVPHRWLIQPAGGHPALPICRSLDLLDFGSADLLLAVNSPLDRLTTLKLPLEWNRLDLVDALLAWPAARQVESLELVIRSVSGVTEESSGIITQLSRYIGDSFSLLKSLTISQNKYRDQVSLSVKLLVSRLLPQLEHLTLGCCCLNGFEALLQTPSTGRLRSLSLEGRGRLPPGQLAQLAATAYPDTLEVLEVPVEDDSLQALLSRPWPRLHALTLQGRLTRDGLQALAASEALPALCELNLAAGNVDVESGHALAAASWLPQLTSLTLKGPELGDDFITVLMAEPAPRRLKKLDLERCPIGGLGLHKLALSAHLLTELRHLKLDDCEITCLGLQTLAAAQAFPRLETLDLTSNPIADDGALALASTTHLRHLRTLKLGACPIQAPGLHALLASPLLEQLNAVRLDLDPVQCELGQYWLREGDPTPVFSSIQKFSKESHIGFVASLMDSALEGSPILQRLTLDNHLSTLDALLMLPPDAGRWSLLVAFFTIIPNECINDDLLLRVKIALERSLSVGTVEAQRTLPLAWLKEPQGGCPALKLANRIYIDHHEEEEGEGVRKKVRKLIVFDGSIDVDFFLYMPGA